MENEETIYRKSFIDTNMVQSPSFRGWEAIVRKELNITPKRERDIDT